MLIRIVVDNHILKANKMQCMLLTYMDECDMSMIVNDHKFAMELFYDSVS